jgi:hypothetical protein
MPKYLAKIENGEVTQVIVCDSIAWAETNLGGTWIETSTERPAGIGYKYDPVTKTFTPPGVQQ